MCGVVNPQFLYYAWDEENQRDVWSYEPSAFVSVAHKGASLFVPNDHVSPPLSGGTTDRQRFWDRTDRILKMFRAFNANHREVNSLFVAVREDTAGTNRCKPKVHCSPSFRPVLQHVDFGTIFRNLGNEQDPEEIALLASNCRLKRTNEALRRELQYLQSHSLTLYGPLALDIGAQASAVDPVAHEELTFPWEIGHGAVGGYGW